MHESLFVTQFSAALSGVNLPAATALHEANLSVQSGVNEIVARVITPEALQLPSTQRLFRLAQHSPVVNQVFGLNLTRGGHTVDVMRLTASLLARLSIESPDRFATMAAEYELDPEGLILHAVEYARLHDSATLAFQGAMHGKVELEEEPYDEDRALVAALKHKPAYAAISEIIDDEETRKYYKNHNIDRTKILQIANDAVGGTSFLTQMVKGGQGSTLSFDSMSYTTRDFLGLCRAFGTDPQSPFAERILSVSTNLQTVSDALKNDTPSRIIPKTIANHTPIEQLIPSNIVRLAIVDNKLVPIYDSRSIFELYATHIMLRVLFSGAPWVRGSNRLIYEFYRDQYRGPTDELVNRLLQHSEAQLLGADLSDALPIGGLSPQSPTAPDSVPFQIKKWDYSDVQVKNASSEKFRLKNIRKLLIDVDEKIILFEKAFPDLIRLVQNIHQSTLYLKQKK